MIAAPCTTTVIPVEAGIQTRSAAQAIPMKDWTPAFAGVTSVSLTSQTFAAAAQIPLPNQLSVLILFPGVK